jgi:hypothetical protein
MPASMRRLPPASASPTKPPRPSTHSPTRRDCSADGDVPAAAEARDRAPGDAFTPKILALARGFAGAPPPDLANASFAELFVWSLAQPPAE